MALKDIFDTRDFPTRYGSALYPAEPARADAAMVGVIRRAGGLLIGKSSTTEFAFLNPTATLNPNAPGRTPGGSSAGSAAAVAAGLVPFAIGTQTGGSVIRPASYCGVTGFKPSFGLLPTAGLKCFSWSLDTVGLFAASVPEVAWVAQALSGRALALEAGPPPKPWVVGVPEAYPWAELSPSARQALDSRPPGIEGGRRRREAHHPARLDQERVRRAGHHPGLRGLAQPGLGSRPAPSEARCRTSCAPLPAGGSRTSRRPPMKPRSALHQKAAKPARTGLKASTC